MTMRDTRHLHENAVHFHTHEDLDSGVIREVSRVTWVGVAVNIALAVVKTTGGLLSGSRVLLADAVHTVSDLATDVAILVGVRYWSAPADAEHPRGHRKIETLITLGIGVALALVGLGLGYEAVASLAPALAADIPLERIDSSAAEIRDLAAWAAMGAALLSIVSKELLFRWTAAKGVTLGSSAVVANAWHHRSDAISSIPPLLAIGGAALGRRLGYDLWFLDPVGTVIVCVMLLEAAWSVVRPTLSALLDSSADRQLCSAIRKTVLTTRGVISTHRIRTRIICSSAVEVDLHISVDRNLSVENGHAIAADVKYRILGLEAPGSRMKPVDVMVHVEPADPSEHQLPTVRSDTMVDWKTAPPKAGGAGK